MAVEVEGAQCGEEMEEEAGDEEGGEKQWRVVVSQRRGVRPKRYIRNGGREKFSKLYVLVRTLVGCSLFK